MSKRIGGCELNLMEVVGAVGWKGVWGILSSSTPLFKLINSMRSGENFLPNHFSLGF
jgi:hypothetical protein